MDETNEMEPDAMSCRVDDSGTPETDAGQSRADVDSSVSFFRDVNIEFLVHELKDPVSIIETGLRMLLGGKGGKGALSPNQQRTLARVMRSAVRTREMLNELLEVGRAENACFYQNEFCPYDILRHTLIEVVEKYCPDIFEEMESRMGKAHWTAFLSARGIRVDATPAAKALNVLLDKIKFSQIVSNLIKNGLHHRRHHLLVHLSCQPEQLSLAVRDDGPGVAPGHHEEIFKRYKQVVASAQVARSGHGLGLAVARRLARAMGGDITIESELGQGALFKLTLPISPPP